MSLPALRAPKEHGQILAVPPLDEVAALLENNRQRFTSTSVSLLGKPLGELRALARREIAAASGLYHREAGENVPEVKSDAWLVAGHQPELFHPGVWYKNFVLHQLAHKHGAASLNLIVDTDTAKPALLHAPSEGRLVRVPFDRSTTDAPYEERLVEDEPSFANFAQRMGPIVAKWNFEPMLASFWREVMAQAKRTPSLGERLAAARRAVERRWGVVQREVPMSRVCQTEAFAYFGCSILSDLPAFHASYNEIVHAYRAAHGIRSRSHPVPDLIAEGDWLEAPFWAWRAGQTRRDRLFVRQSGSAWQLRVAGELWPSISISDCVEGWRALQTQGFKIRSRALTTTMFARLCLADAFIHGIGGGIYDELTDRIIERFFRIPAPAFLVLSATLLLPLPRYPDAAERIHQRTRQQRDLVYKPERFVVHGAATEALVRAKAEWIGRACATHAERAERFHRIRAINAELAPVVQAKVDATAEALEVARREAAVDEVAARRDYAFCLYPEEMLRAFFVGRAR